MDVSANNTVTIGGGCTRKRTVDVSTPTKALHGFLEMEDRNGNGTIDDVSWYSFSGEGYRKELDLNKDGKVTPEEAWQGYYLNSSKQLPFRSQIDEALKNYLMNEHIPAEQKVEELRMIGRKGVEVLVDLYKTSGEKAPIPDGKPLILDKWDRLFASQAAAMLKETCEKLCMNGDADLKIRFARAAIINGSEKTISDLFEISAYYGASDDLKSASREAFYYISLVEPKTLDYLINTIPQRCNWRVMGPEVFSFEEELRGHCLANKNLETYVYIFNTIDPKQAISKLMNYIKSDSSGVTYALVAAIISFKLGARFGRIVGALNNKAFDGVDWRGAGGYLDIIYPYISPLYPSGNKDVDIENINVLIGLLDKNIMEKNRWYGSEVFSRANYEAASMIGDIALSARTRGDRVILERIDRQALPKILKMLRWQSERDYGIVYIEYPMKFSLLMTIRNIGNASVIPYIENNCRDIDYDSRYKKIGHSFFSVANEKKETIDYLRKQSRTNEFIEPPR